MQSVQLPLMEEREITYDKKYIFENSERDQGDEVGRTRGVLGSLEGVRFEKIKLGCSYPDCNSYNV